MGVGVGPSSSSSSRCRSTGATMSVTHRPPASSNGNCCCCCINIYVNNNVQGVTNSVLFGSSVTMRDPGARVVSSRRPPRAGRVCRGKRRRQQKKMTKTMIWAAAAMVCLAIAVLMLGVRRM
ncbi:hypothetical protein ACQ4PT_027435 [Festuca glaucescens]